MEADRVISNSQATNVLITGAGSGIGAACAERFLAEGWHVIGLDRAAGSLEEIAWVEADVTDWDGLGRASEDLPPLGAVINCAGIGSREPAIGTGRDEWDHVVAVNLSGTFYVARWTFPRLREGGGVLVNIGSVNGTNGFRNRAVYSATKAAVISLSRSLAIEWAEYGIRVLTVSPGFTRTPLVEQGFRERKTLIEYVLSHTPQQRLIEPQEVAAAIFRFVGPDFSAVTGANLLVDGGFDALSGF
jgi:NAD(P)-dependent dehydrogenase (short-subunit alcohol dehydrogenase family)